MPRKPVDVSNYDREKNGRTEHVDDYTRMQDVRGGSGSPPAMLALRRKTRTGDPAVTTATDFQDYEISGKIVESGVPFPNMEPPDTMQHNHYKIRIKNKKTGVSRTFDFFGSQHDYQQGKEELERTDLLEAFSNIINEADMGEYDFEAFASEFGYDADSRMAEKIWRGVKGQARKVHELGIEGDDLLLLAQEVRGELEGY